MIRTKELKNNQRKKGKERKKKKELKQGIDTFLNSANDNYC
jgi:hypothetical protein